MQINIAARRGHLSPAHQERIQEKVQKLSKFHDRISHAEVTVDLEHHETIKLEVKVTVENAGEFVATDAAAETLTALDGALKKLEHQLRKHKEKITDHHKPGHRAQSGEAD